jgi:hypothetical protein
MMSGLKLAFARTLTATVSAAQAAAPKPEKTPAARSVPAAPRATARSAGTLAQITRGIYFSYSNLILDVQENEPAAPKPKPGDAGGSGTATYASMYSGWESVETPRLRSPMDQTRS